MVGTMDEEPKQEGIDVPEPKGWTWPDGVEPEEGDKFMCTIIQGPEGMLTIKDIDGLPVEKPEPPAPKEKEMGPMDFFRKGRKQLEA